MQDVVIGESAALAEVLAQTSRLAAIDRPALVVGERGAGKELIARRLHYLSPRWEKPLVTLNCASLSESLLDSELFGHEAGAFTGAVRRRAGRFERADGGTLFLDEIATASLAVQEKLLRIVEYGVFERLGSSDPVAVNVRIVAATNVDLPACAAAGKFRADLLDRLAFAVLTVPPLRARPDDILPLARHFGLAMAIALKRPLFPGFTRSAERGLLDYAWPGNIRELKNLVERAVAQSTEPETPIANLNFDPFDSPWRPHAAPSLTKPAELAEPGEAAEAPASAYDFAGNVAAYERRLLTAALARNRHQQKRTAAYLGLEYHQLRALLRRHGLGPGRAAGAAQASPGGSAGTP